MPQGDKSAYTDKQRRQAEHIAEGYRAQLITLALLRRQPAPVMHDLVLRRDGVAEHTVRPGSQRRPRHDLVPGDEGAAFQLRCFGHEISPPPRCCCLSQFFPRAR